MFADEDEDGRGAVPKLGQVGHGPGTRFNLVSRNVLIEWSRVEWSSHRINTQTICILTWSSCFVISSTM